MHDDVNVYVHVNDDAHVHVHQQEQSNVQRRRMGCAREGYGSRGREEGRTCSWVHAQGRGRTHLGADLFTRRRVATHHKPHLRSDSTES